MSIYCYCITAQIEGDLRLIDSATTDGKSGRLEIFLRGEWGTVCDDRFGLMEANVACRQLGFSAVSREGNANELG